MNNAEFEFTHLCEFYPSSISGAWEKNFSGVIKDPASVQSGFWFLSEEELDPFIWIELPCSLRFVILKIDVSNCFKDSKALVSVTTYHDDEILSEYQLGEGPSEIRLAAGNSQKRVNKIRLSKAGVCAIALSRISLVASTPELISSIREVPYRRICFADGSFYGLGGKLNVYSSAILFCVHEDSRSVVLDQTADGLIQYPLSVTEKKGEVRGILDRYASKSIKNFIEKREEYKKQTAAGLHKPVKNLHFSENVFKYISRNDVSSFCCRGEDILDVTRRAFKKIVPSGSVFDKLHEIEERFSLKDKYSEALAIHFRHGNGERYFSKRRNRWGVKPAPCCTLGNAVIDFFAVNNTRVDYVVVATDCAAVADYVRSVCPEDKEVVFLDHGVQPVGAGCSHNENLFDLSRERCEVNPGMEQIETFAQILALSKCRYQMGGKSFFFEAAKAFSETPKEDIFFIDNSDRYARLSDSFFPVLESDVSGASIIIDRLRGMGVALDGVFLGVVRGNFCLSYFDDVLVEGASIEGVADKVDSQIEEKIKDLRFY